MFHPAAAGHPGSRPEPCAGQSVWRMRSRRRGATSRPGGGSLRGRLGLWHLGELGPAGFGVTGGSEWESFGNH